MFVHVFSSFSNQSAKMRSYRVISKIFQRKWNETGLKSMLRNKSLSSPSGTPGSGAGRGGGAGGSVRESGGGLGRYGAAQEEQFFFNKQREQLEKLKKKLKEEKAGELSQKKEK
ncbi:ATPase inhibitor mai-2, mitochondrial-like [Vanessa atalanta]|uniref:ATPase inhibitor mai-2, mitochondrial-like n=1 Tax=Vanessa atalanta TaxID=42275 RepID=UPI001FCD28C8|nr:ATPase inhibitor mai-2, mitochondrial-like [Vanessa atalanta]